MGGKDDFEVLGRVGREVFYSFVVGRDLVRYFYYEVYIISLN